MRAVFFTYIFCSMFLFTQSGCHKQNEGLPLFLKHSVNIYTLIGDQYKIVDLKITKDTVVVKVSKRGDDGFNVVLIDLKTSKIISNNHWLSPVGATMFDYYILIVVNLHDKY